MTEREMVGREQVLDSMDIERERGITIKAQTVRLTYRAEDGKDYILNLIDTPGHVDFAYEVNRSLAACEGSLLVVDASQGVEAQTLANVYHALDAGHEIVPVLNKVDLPAAEPDKVKQQIEDVIGLDAHDALMISAKTGVGIHEVLEAIVHRLPAPKGDRGATLKALLVDSWYDAYLGVVVLVRIVDGVLKAGQRIRMMGTNAAYEVDRVGTFTPKLTPASELGPGEIGFLTASIKEVADTRVGDTITDDREAGLRDAARLQARHSGRVLRPVSRRRGAVRRPARRHGQAAPQRRQLLLRDGDVGRARLARRAGSPGHRLERPRRYRANRNSGARRCAQRESDPRFAAGGHGGAFHEHCTRNQSTACDHGNLDRSGDAGNTRPACRR